MERRVKGLDGLARALKEDLGRRLFRVVVRGAAKAGQATAHEVAQNVPVAFAELRKSIHLDASEAARGKISVVSDAPHAAAAEKGSRPHTPPIQPLLAWVKLRGMQGLTARGNIRSATRKAWGNTTASQANRIATRIRSYRATGDLITDIQAPMRIARAIQAAIRKRGTKPTWFMRKQLGYAVAVTDREVRAAVSRSAG